MTFDYSIAEVTPYVNWIYFFHAWGVGNRPEAEQRQLQTEAMERLQRYADRYHTHAVFRLYDCHSSQDDIVLEGGGCIPCLRQQHGDCLCLADFVSPNGTKIGIFATTADKALETDFDHDPYEKMMMQLLADRLAEATAELLHKEVRRRLWGYASDEQLTVEEMLQERWQGIRPAVGYPSLPDTSLNFVIDELIDMKQIGIRLTESGAMKPHASVSGLMMAHQAARYFSVGKIGTDQLADYARRRGLPVEVVRKFLGGNL